MAGAFLLCLLLAGVQLGQGVSRLQEQYSWTQLDWEFPNEILKMQALASGNYIPTNGLPVGVERWQNKLFVTVPRWRDGIPATLNYIDMDRNPSGLNIPLIPYPSLQQNVAGDCANGLSTVYRIKVDQCGRLWVLDTGTVGIGNTTQNVCPYAINVFDLQTNRRIRRYEFRPEDTNANTFIANTAVDIGQSCEDTFVYFSDELGYGLIVYSFEENKTWRFEHSFFFPDPLRGDFNIAGLNFQWGEEGIFGITLSPILKDGFRALYFSPLASHREFAVSTRILRNESKVEDSYHDFVYLPERAENSHTTSRVMDDNGLMLFNLIDQNSVGCWHSSFPYSPEYHGIVDRDDVALVFPADVKIDYENIVWVISDRMPVFLIAELDYTDVNFRIFSAPLDTLVAGTVCDVKTQLRAVNRYLAPTVTLDTTQSLATPTVNAATTRQPALPNSIILNTQLTSTPKAFAFNQHNGVTFEAQGEGLVASRAYKRNGRYLSNGLLRYTKPTWWNPNAYETTQ